MPPALRTTLQKQRFLFLQGVCSPFFPRLADALRAHGHDVRKVNFTVGDRMYWRRGNAVSYRGPMDALPDFYKQQFEAHGTTDIVLFGDCRPVHRPAIELAKALNLRVHVFEEGYFRPFWITLEQGGVNGHSSLPGTLTGIVNKRSTSRISGMERRSRRLSGSGLRMTWGITFGRG